MADPILIDTASMDPAASLTGAELVAVVQGGADKRSTTQDIANLAASAAPAGLPESWLPLPQIVAADYAVLNARSAGALTSFVGVTNSAYFYPFAVGRSINLTALAIDVTIAAASSLTDIGIYAAGSNLLPGARLAFVSGLNSGTPGKKEGAITLTLAAGLYFVALKSSSNPTFRAVDKSASMTFGSWGTPPTITQAVGIRVAAGGLSSPAPTASLLSDNSAAVAFFAKFTG